MENPVLIFGAGALGRSAKDMLESNNNVIYGFLDDSKALHGTEIDDVTVLGSTDDDGFLKLIGKKCEACLATDDLRLRKALVKMLAEVRHVQPVNAVHRLASVSPRALMGHGNLIDRGVQLGPGVVLGNYCVIQAGVILAVEVTLGDHVQVGAGAVINSGVKVGDDVFIGSGAVLVAGITVGKGARIGAGSVVIASVADGETVFGNPAQKVKV
jgi:sugar O-acyltransferase (sialic acid O-acetyltransferase NeuD family)